MTAISGTNVSAPITPFDTSDTYPTHDAAYGKGGFKSVVTIVDRDNIPSARRSLGMRVNVTGDVDSSNNGDWEWNGTNFVRPPTPQLDAAVAAASSHEAGAEGFRDEAENFADVAQAGIAVPEYATKSAALSATSEGALCAVLAGGSDGLTRRTVYRKTSGNLVLVTDPVSGAEYDNSKDDAGIHTRARLTLLANGITDEEQINTILSAGGYVNFSSGDLLFNGLPYSGIDKLTALTFSRASSAYAPDAAGVYQSFGVNVPRRVAGRGLLLEPSATLLLAQPVDLSNADWVKSGVSAVSVSGGAPDGVGAAYDLTESSTATASGTYISKNQPLAAGSYCFSAHLKRAGLRYTMIIIVAVSSYAAVINGAV